MRRLVLLLALSALLVACGQPSTSPNPDPTVQAQATRIAALQQQIATLQTAAPQATITPTKAPPAKPTSTAAVLVPNTPVTAARSFIQALVAGDANSAAQLMSASTDATTRAALPGISAALRACSASQTEASPSGSVVIVRFFPPCSSYGTFDDALPATSPIRGAWRSGRIRPLDQCQVIVSSVNNQFKISAIPGCIPVQ